MKTSELIEQIESRIRELAIRAEEAKSSEEVTQYLQFLSRFHRYSLHNTMSIWIHCPPATHVAGYNAWMKLGRYVRKGEKGIPVFAPCTQAVPDPDDADEKIRKVVGYKIVYVFDVAQTEGRPLPDAPIVAQGDGSELLPVLEGIASNLGIGLEYTSMSGSHHGTSYVGRIEVDSELDDAGKASVIVHELAHELLHKGADRILLSSRQKETEAESIAYVVCAHFGLDSAAPNYLALWAAKPEQIIEAFQRIRDVAASLIDMIEAKFKVEEVCA